MADKVTETEMTEAQEPAAAPEDDPCDWYASALRSHSLEEIQSAIAKALSDLAGKKYEIEIVRLNFAPKWAGGASVMMARADMRLRISSPDTGKSPF
jgi:hypothetical protein